MSHETNFSGALATWRGACIALYREYILTIISPGADINLSELQKTLDVQGIEVVDNQKESVIGRKALADKTKGVCRFKLKDEPGCQHSIARIQKDT